MKSLFTYLLIISFFTSFSQSFTESLIYNNQEGGVQRSIATADFDGDGLQDVLMAGSSPNVFWVKNLGNNQFGVKQTIFDDEIFGERAKPIDINNDGLMDIAAACSFSNVIVTILSNGDGTFENAVVLENQLEPLTDLKIFDIDNDGFDDISYSTYSSSNQVGKIYWNKNDGNGGFLSRAVIAPNSLETFNIEFADIDGDDLFDLISLSHWDDKFVWFKNMDNGNFSSEIEVRPLGESLGERALYTEDMDADGDIDLLTYVSPDIVIYNNDGSGNFTTSTISISSFSWGLIARDFDQDGHMDIFSGAGDTDEAIVIYGEGNGSYQMEEKLAQNIGNIIDLWITDMDDDGVQDVLTASALHDGFSLFTNNYNGPLSIDRTEQKIEVNIYPNPTSSEITINSLDLNEVRTIEIINTDGHRVLAQSTNTTDAIVLSLKKLPKGYYAVILKDWHGNIVSKKKVIKTR